MYTIYNTKGCNMKILEYKNKVLLSILLILLFAIIYLLVSNVARGFDITDESYYILYAEHQDEIYPVIRRDGVYTGMLYALTHGNLAYFRLSGIILLLIVSTWLAVEIVKYLSTEMRMIINKWFLIIPIIISSLGYYRYWLLTPSYNWLALLSIMLVLIALLRVINRKYTNYKKIFAFDYLLLAFSLNLAFMAKPTTALILALIIFLFTIIERKNVNLFKAYFSIFVLTIAIVLMHIIWAYGDFSQYYDRLIESLHRMSTVDPRYTLNDRITTTIKEFKDFFFEKYYFQRIKNLYIFIIIILILLAVTVKTYRRIGVLVLYLIFISYIYLLFNEGLILKLKAIWFRLTELLTLSWVIVFISLLYTAKFKIFFRRYLFLFSITCVFSLGSIAYALGTNGTMIYAMSSSIIFIVIGIMIANTIIDNILSVNIFLVTAGIAISIFVFHVLLSAYNNPYRLITNITDQNQKVDLLGGLYVDEVNKKYIETLKRIKEKYTKSNQKITLLDMTGGSPGANVILDADFFGEPWLAGAYPGSNKSLKMILESYRGSKKLKEAWILTAPKGKRKLDLIILNDFDLNFPENYEKIQILKTAHRAETQELWRPKKN